MRYTNLSKLMEVEYVMIGMSQIKKKTLQGVAIGCAIGVVGIGLTVWWALSTIKSYENGTNKKYLAKYTKNVAVLTKDVVQGETISDDMLTTVTIHNNTVPSGVLDLGDISGKVAKYSIAARVPITSNMVTDEVISSDVRSQEVNTVLMPSDLNTGDIVDVRIMFPNGTDYIVLAQKNVTNIEGETMWLQLAEDERLLLNSAVVDSFLEQGTKLYATKYVDQDAQIKVSDEEAEKAEGYVQENIKDKIADIKDADETELTTIVLDLVKEYKNFATTVTRTKENYQPNTKVMDLIKSNSNILDQAKAKLNAETRANMENALKEYEDNNEEKFGNVVSGSQQSITTQKTQRDQLVSGNVE